jgi:methyl-accepting chemotaxis protein
MLAKMKLNAKILGAIALTLFLTSAVSFWITQRRINQQAEEGFREKVRQITGMAGATRSWFSDNIDTLVPGGNFKSLNQVPVVVAWSVARQYATAQNMEFHTPSLTPRDAKNQPDEFERRALEAFQRDPAITEYSDRMVENGQDIMRYAQAVRLTQDCLLCHGDPVGAKDPFGFAKEGMKVGDLRGAFTVKASTEGLVQTARSNSIALFLTGFLTLLAAAGVLVALVRKLVTKPLSSVVALADKIAGNNLAMDDLPVESGDEIGDATAALNKMKNNLRGLVQAISETSVQVASASEELSSTSQQITANSEETTAQAHVVSDAGGQVNTNLQTLATGAEEMDSTIGEIAKSATEAARIAGEAVSAAESANRTVSLLGDSSVEIGKVIEVITSIAQQTNLLALNATIEAARAGEAGKGFAVVANEVKELAKQTAKATEEIKQKIAVIRENTGGAVAAIGGIKGVIDKISQISTEIATAVEEQSATTSEMSRNVTEAARGASTISDNIKGVAHAAQDTSNNVTQAQTATEHLAKMANQLRDQVSRFKVDGEGATRWGEGSSIQKKVAGHAAGGR